MILMNYKIHGYAGIIEVSGLACIQKCVQPVTIKLKLRKYDKLIDGGFSLAKGVKKRQDKDFYKKDTKITQN